MDYTINQLATLAGVTTRTLRYYDQINLLTPSYTNQSGYRIYSNEEVDRLQQILFFRELDIKLKDIRAILTDPKTNYLTLLIEHRAALSDKKKRIDRLLTTIDQTIDSQKGVFNMTDQQKFEAFKQELVDENEKKFGAEIREKYQEDSIEQANATLLKMTAEDYHAWQATEAKLLSLLTDFATTTIPSEKAEKIFHLHKSWLSANLKDYTSATHQGIANMYIADPRFTAYYDEKAGTGAAVFLNETIQHYAR